MELATLYVDVENLQDIAHQAITYTIEHWPPEIPKIGMLQLYVKADQTQLWNIWASHEFPSLRLRVEGVQRYGSVSKNLADMSLILDALADIVKERTSHVAVLSDDSDYVVLFAAIKKEIGNSDNNRVPFTWFLTDRPHTHSSGLNDFLPSTYLRTIICTEKHTSTAVKAKEKAKDDEGLSENELIARIIVQNIPVGPFKNADCMLVVQEHLSDIDLSHEDSAKFGLHFSKSILPILKRHGVKVLKGRNPRKYEMTDEAKKNVPSAD